MEFNQRLEQIYATLRELRQNAGDGRKTRQSLDSLFRTIHSLKAAASAEGLNDLSRAAHEFEDLLHRLRTGKLTLDAEVLQAFDEAAASLSGGTETDLVDRLTEPTSDTSEPPDSIPAGFTALKDDERHRAAEAMREGSNLYVIEAVFEIGDFDQRFRQLKEQLERMAEVISTSAAMDENKIKFQILYAATSEKIRVQTILQQAVFAGRSLAEKLAKEVTFIVHADELLLEKPVAGALADSLLHLVRNAVDHGIELHGTIFVEAAEGRIAVTDDGHGIDPANIPLLFEPGFSTAAETTDFSGRGVGLDAVKAAVEQFGGSVSVKSEPGKGSSFEITLPVQITLPSPSSDA